MATRTRELDEAGSKLASSFRTEIAHRYDSELARGLIEYVDLFMRTFFISRTKVDGIDVFRSIPKDVPVILSSIHKSHLDYVMIGLTLIKEDESYFPATVAGKNLYHGIFEQLFPRLKGVCLDRERVKSRNLRSKENLLYLSTFYDYLMEDVVNAGDMITIFPEAGRSYSGAILPLSLGIFGIAKRALHAGNERVAIVPVGVTYERVSEDTRFAGLAKCKERSDDLYRNYDKQGFYHHALLQPNTICYLAFGAPLYVTLEDLKHLEELAGDLRTRMGEMVYVTVTALVARAVGGKKLVPMKDVLAHMAKDVEYITQHGLRAGRGVLRRPPRELFARAERHLNNPLRFRSILEVVNRRGVETVYVRRREVMQYYANTVAHLFGSET